MTLTKKQEEGLRIAVERYRNGELYTVISGYAGTGKSTLVKYIIAALGVSLDHVAYIAYTGKAAQVLRRKGCANAMTGHRLLYTSVPLKNGNFKHIPKESIDPYDVIVVDEVSMFPDRMWTLLLSHRKYVIALGDPGQLPPVCANQTEVLNHPHIFLDEIMRQAQESEIIRLTMDIREGKTLNPYSGEQVRIVRRNELQRSGFLFWGDQILCAKNATRRQLNNLIRKGKFNIEDTLPIVGDKIICLHNDWEFVNAAGDALVNGLSGNITDLTYLQRHDKGYNPYTKETPIITLAPDYEGQNNNFYNLEIDYRIFAEGVPTIDSDNWSRIPKLYHPHEFDYGYAITTWKAQGSEWNKVIGFVEYMKSQTKEDVTKFLYTMATRASEKLILVLPY